MKTVMEMVQEPMTDLAKALALAPGAALETAQVKAQALVRALAGLAITAEKPELAATEAPAPVAQVEVQNREDLLVETVLREVPMAMALMVELKKVSRHQVS